MNRRTALLSITALAGGAAISLISGCTTATPGAGLSPDSIAKFAALANGLLSIAGTEASILGATPAQVAQIAEDARLAQAALTALQPGLTAAAAAPSLNTIVAEVNDALRVLGPLISSLPAPIGQIVLAIEVLLPVAEASAGIAPPAAPMARAGAMSPVAAQALLAGARR